MSFKVVYFILKLFLKLVGIYLIMILRMMDKKSIFNRWKVCNFGLKLWFLKFNLVYVNIN